MKRNPVPVNLGFPGHGTEGSNQHRWKAGVWVQRYSLLAWLVGLGMCVRRVVRLVNEGVKRSVKPMAWFSE